MRPGAVEWCAERSESWVDQRLSEILQFTLTLNRKVGTKRGTGRGLIH